MSELASEPMSQSELAGEPLSQSELASEPMAEGIRVSTQVVRRFSAMALAALLTRVLFVAGTALLAVRAVTHLAAGGTVHLAAGLLMVAYLAWVVLEIRVTFKDQSAAAAESGTLVAYASSRTLVGICAVLPAVPWSGWSPWLLVPVAVFGAGIALRFAAIRALGAQYTHQVVRRDDHVLVTGGPYRFLRHPAYSGMLLANAGFVAFFANPAAVFALALLAAALGWRVVTEERVLWPLPGYPEFAATRPRLIPGVW
ncbi:methyltransferase family protein [Actinokineospora sp.]|uniref:methyltransferase family protein n=1 Tax=Actinokineospora sp. TaxID=1872133 RepID=UPI004037DD0A